DQPRPRPDAVPIALQNNTPKEPLPRVRTNEAPQGAAPRVRKAATQRITEEPEQLRPRLSPRRKRRKQTGGVWALATGLVSLLLIALILMPRFLGISIFPAG